MKQYQNDNLVIHPRPSDDASLIVEVTPELAGWDTLYFQARHLEKDEQCSFQTGENELALVVLGGQVNIDSTWGSWQEVGQRATVFNGLPTALYLPRRTACTISALTTCEFAATWVACTQDHPARLVRPEDIRTEIRGGDNATRQINSILPPGFPCERLVVVEVYTPGGSWSSYPPHKHDVHKTASDGSILEADLDEIYYYKIDRPEGYAFQRVYTDPESPLHQAGYPIDSVVKAQNNDVVIIPEGYHPVVSPPGYTTYYLNVLAGSAQSLAASDDPAYAWVKTSYRGQDPRVPFYPTNPA